MADDHVKIGRETYSALKAMSKAHVDAERMRRAEEAEAAGDVDAVVRAFLDAQKATETERTRRQRQLVIAGLAALGLLLAASGGTFAMDWLGIVDLSFSGSADVNAPAQPEEAP